jgi:hypothetical protein
LRDFCNSFAETYTARCRGAIFSETALAFPQEACEYVDAVAVVAKTRHIDNEADRTEHRNAW